MTEIEYLSNPICKFKVLFDINYNKKTNIFSTCFFKMVGSGYKDFSKYINGLIKINNQIDKYKLNYMIRLFIDNSIYLDKKIYDQITKLKNVQPVLYSCPNYIINNDYHIGLFSSIIRLFPMFNFSNNDAGNVVIADIDETNMSIVRDFENFLRLRGKKSSNINSQIYLFKSGPLNRSLKYDFNIMYKNKFNPYVFALSFISNTKINNSVLIDFFDQVEKSPNDMIYSFHYPMEIKKKIDEKIFKSKYTDKGKFIYGIDEYFLNITLAHYLEDNKLCYASKTKWDIFGCLYYLLDEQILSPKELRLINLVFKYIFKKINFAFDESKTPNDNFKKLDNIVYSKNFQNKKNAYKINFLLYKLFLYFKTNPNYKFLFPIEYYKLWVDDEKYFGIYDIDLIKSTNCNGKDEDYMLEYKKFAPNDIKRLKKFYLERCQKIN